MHLALVVDPERLAYDGVALERLAVALAAEGTQVTRILPTSAAEASTARLIPVRTLDFDGSPLFRRGRLGALSSAMEEQRPDVFIAFGARALAAAAELADDLEAVLVSMIATEDELARTPLRKHVALIDAVGVATAPLVARAAKWVPEDLVRMMPLGVAVPTTPVPAAHQSLAIAGAARDVGAYRAVFAALADVASALPDLQVAIELPPGHDPRIWALAREYRIQGLLNGVQRLEQIRPLALACGVMVLPEPVRGTRSVILESMASGRLAVAMEDSMANYLIDGITALVAQSRDAKEWTRLLTKALLEESAVAPVRAEGALRVAALYGSSKCAAQVLDACTVAVRGPVIPFPTG